VAKVTPEIHAMASRESGSGMGSGGMSSKLQAAEIAELAGIALVIANGTHDRPLDRVTGQGIGTLFQPRRKAGARKAWLGGRLRLKGELFVDAGAAGALERGSSLLAKGVVDVRGIFERGDPVAICAQDGRVLAHGLAEYDSSDCAKIVGRHSNEHAALLGYAPRPVVIHRDHLVLK